MRVLPPGQPRPVEQGDGPGGHDEDHNNWLFLLPVVSAGRSTRTIRNSQSSSPTNKRICQPRPRSTYSYPWWPQRKEVASDSLFDAQPFAGERADHDDEQRQKQHIDAERLPFGSSPLTSGPINNPAASQAVAIQKRPI